MSYHQTHTCMSVRVPRSIRDSYAKTKDFWKEMNRFWTEISRCVEKTDLDRLIAKYPTIIKFIEVLP